MARANTFVQPIGSGWYRYHTLFAEVLRLKLRLRYPERVPELHRRAARFYARNGSLTDAVRHAAKRGDWPLAASVVVDGLAITEITGAAARPVPGRGVPRMPASQAWDAPQPYLVRGGDDAGRRRAATPAPPRWLPRKPSSRSFPPAGRSSRLAAAMLRLAASRQSGDLPAAAAAAAHAEALVSPFPGDMLARHPAIRARVLAGRGVVELWSGHLDEAVRALGSGVTAATASGAGVEQAECLGYLALAEALRGGLGRAAELAARAAAAVRPASRSRRSGGRTPRRPSPWPGSTWSAMSCARHAPAQAGGRRPGASPDKLTGAVAWLVAARAGLAEGRHTSPRSAWPRHGPAGGSPIGSTSSCTRSSRRPAWPPATSGPHSPRPGAPTARARWRPPSCRRAPGGRR